MAARNGRVWVLRPEEARSIKGPAVTGPGRAMTFQDEQNASLILALEGNGDIHTLRVVKSIFPELPPGAKLTVTGGGGSS